VVGGKAAFSEKFLDIGGLSVEETAEVLGVSPETVMRDWKMAKTWLFRELSKASHAKPPE
jgi:DNA-directed RNA polymerase specialized sigma24 family protein